MASGVSRSPPCGISVLISGAGVGGLMTALECWRIGCDVRIFEKTKQSSTQGDSLTIGPSALNAFNKHWPYMAKKRHEIAYSPLLSLYDVKGNLLKGPIRFNSMASDSNKAAELCRYMRPDFHAMMLEQLHRIGLKVEFDNDVVEYFEDGQTCRAGVVLKDGSRHDADLVVAADGIRTASWLLIAGRPVPARSSGQSIFRVAYPAEVADADPIVADRFKLDENGDSTVEMFSGPNCNGVIWRNDKWMSWGLIHPSNYGNAEENWSHRVDVAEALKFTASLEGWPEVADRVIKATPSGSIVDWPLMWRDPQPTWTSPSGHVVQVGDAAHTLLPTSGNGGTQALEDAISLAACLNIAGKEKITDATRVHNLLRFERVSFLQAMGLANREKRNTNKSKDGTSKPFVIGAWLAEHDPEQYAYENFEEALANITSGAPFKNTNTPPGVEYQPWTIDSLTEAMEKGEKSILDGGWH